MFPLKRNSRGELVRVLQYGLGLITDGIFGPNTEKSVKKWQKKMFLEQTGEISVGVWETFFQFELLNMKHLQLGEFLMNVRELDIDGDGTPDNRSEVIDVMTSSVWSWWEGEDKKQGPPWCAIFISYLMNVSYDYPFKDARVKKWLEHLEEVPQAKRLHSTDQFYKDKVYIGGWVKSSGYGHIFFVDPKKTLKYNKSGMVATLEGNTNKGGSRDGDGVYSRYRLLDDSDFLFEVLAKS